MVQHQPAGSGRLGVCRVHISHWLCTHRVLLQHSQGPACDAGGAPDPVLQPDGTSQHRHGGQRLAVVCIKQLRRMSSVLHCHAGVCGVVVWHSHMLVESRNRWYNSKLNAHHWVQVPNSSSRRHLHLHVRPWPAVHNGRHVPSGGARGSVHRGRGPGRRVRVQRHSRLHVDQLQLGAVPCGCLDLCRDPAHLHAV